MRKLFIPFEYVSPRKIRRVYIGWFLLIILFWVYNSFVGDVHLFPTIPQVYNGFIDLMEKDFVPHLYQTIKLSIKSVFFAVFISVGILYVTPLAIMRPLGNIVSQLRYLPFVGISFFMAILFPKSGNLQVSILVLFTTTFLVTSLLSYLKDIPEEEYDNAKTMGLSRWETLWQVIIIGRMDYVFEAIRQNLAIVTMSIVTVETILPSSGGIGYLLGLQSRLGNHGSIIAIQLFLLITTLLLDRSINLIRKKLFPFSTF